jgi:glycosyltransferase involved in cell wall biosynthesis
VATHDPQGPDLAPLRVVVVAGAEEARLLTHAAALCVLPRTIPGGFPVKLLNYMEAARPLVARTPVADGLEDGRNALLLPAAAGPTELAKAVARVLEDPELAAELGRGGRELLERRHAWARLAGRTLDLVAALRCRGA